MKKIPNGSTVKIIEDLKGPHGKIVIAAGTRGKIKSQKRAPDGGPGSVYEVELDGEFELEWKKFYWTRGDDLAVTRRR